MSQENMLTHTSHRRSFRCLLVALIITTVIVLSQSLQLALAWIPPNGEPRVEPTEPPFIADDEGFDWWVPNRFGRDDNQDGLIDYHYNSALFQYDESWLYPESWPMIFDGCRTEADASDGYSTTNTYKWVLNGETIEGNLCRFTYGKNSPNAGNLGFPAQGTYGVDLEVTYTNDADSPTGQNPETFHQNVVVRDILIVSLGDSYASGEGVPDIRQKYDLAWGVPIWKADAVWQDKRCHRSAKGGPPLAAMAIERMDPKTSVTFISYACSGATIGTELFDSNLLGLPDPHMSRGVGVLEPYRGQDVPGDFPYSSRAVGWNGYIPSQIGQLKAVLIPPEGKSQRQIDALVISGGGNDTHFGEWMAACLLSEPCWDWTQIQETPNSWPFYTPRQLVNRALGIDPGREADSVPVNYERLAAEFATINPAPLNVYVTQYPDGTTGDNGGYCRMLDDVFWPDPHYAINPWESSEISEHALKFLNKTIFDAVKQRQSLGWVYVDGLANFINNENDPFGPVGLFYKHGYCASQNWIVRAEESELAQGPLYWRAGTKGLAHPNILGNQVIRDRLLHYMVPRLLPPPQGNPPDIPPAIGAPVYAIGSLVNVPGASGWYIGSCQDGNCYPKAVLQVIGSAEAGVYGAGVTIDGVDACTVSGVTCRTDGGLSADKKQYTWNIEFTADGIYNLQFSLSDKVGASANGSALIKVDLHDPVLNPVGPFMVSEGGAVMLNASVQDSEGSPVSYTWDLNNDGDFETYDQQPEFSAASLDGPASQTIQVKATDQAGRTASAQALITVVNVAPTAEITGVMESNPEGTAINLSSSVTDPGAADTFSYDWSVTTNGSVIASGSEADLSFTPRDNGAYDVSLKVTDDDGGETTVIRTINVLNEPPIPGILGVPDSVYEGTMINLTSSVSDPGLDDTFTYAWTVKKNGVDYASGSNTNFSFTPDDNGSYVVSLNVSDNDGGVGSTSQTITVVNAAPVLSNISVTPGTINEGGAVTVSGNISDPGSADSFVLTVTWGDGSAANTTSLPSGSTSFSRSHTYADDNPTGTASDTNNISLSLKDKDEDTGTGSASVVVKNLVPSLSITAPADGTLYAINTSVSLSGEFSDGGTLDTFSCSVDWGDGVTVSGTLAAGKCSASHAYNAAGVYNVKMTVSDDDTGSDVKTVMVVVYDPSAGFVTGGGWINSPTGAYKLDGSLTGKATFGFVSKYQKGTTIPTGNTAFQFQVAAFEFNSTAYEWLVVNTAGTNAQFKGSGLVNDGLDPNGKAFKFMLWATDGATSGVPDTFRIRIWWEDAAGEHDVYDNCIDQAISGGSIVVHTKK
jgi:PKD repeat protein